MGDGDTSARGTASRSVSTGSCTGRVFWIQVAAPPLCDTVHRDPFCIACTYAHATPGYSQNELRGRLADEPEPMPSRKDIERRKPQTGRTLKRRPEWFSARWRARSPDTTPPDSGALPARSPTQRSPVPAPHRRLTAHGSTDRGQCVGQKTRAGSGKRPDRRSEQNPRPCHAKLKLMLPEPGAPPGPFKVPSNSPALPLERQQPDAARRTIAAIILVFISITEEYVAREARVSS